MDKTVTFKDIITEMAVLYEKKNRDYGDSTSNTYKKFGLVSYLTRVNDKLSRIETLLAKGSPEIKEESIRDNLIDIANYCIIAVKDIDNNGLK